jgi:hypothetical protein
MGESECLNNDQGQSGTMLNWGQGCFRKYMVKIFKED